MFSLQFSKSTSYYAPQLSLFVLISSAPARFAHDLLSNFSALERIIEAHTIQKGNRDMAFQVLALQTHKREINLICRDMKTGGGYVGRA